jgi:diadenylate cyclase
MLPRLTPTAVLDILLVAAVVYNLLLILRGRRAAAILAGLVILVAVYMVASWLHLELLRTLLATLAPYSAFALIVIFQAEIRRMLARIGRRNWFSFGARLERREALEDLLLATQDMAQTSTGALIVIEREIGLRTFIESGVPLDARISQDLLMSIFRPGGALHDGAVIVQGDRVAAAACFLPLTMNPVSRNLGTRHRAGIGVTEETDCLSVIVSEETGRISIASGGDIESDVTVDRLRERLAIALGFRHQPARKAAHVRKEFDQAQES